MTKVSLTDLADVLNKVGGIDEAAQTLIKFYHRWPGGWSDVEAEERALRFQQSTGEFEEGFHDGYSNALQRVKEGTVVAPLKWVSFKDRVPPASAALDDPTVTTIDKVLVTNNIEAVDRMGRPSHVWYGAPTYDGHNDEWLLYDEGWRQVNFLTHWCLVPAPLKVDKQ